MINNYNSAKPFSSFFPGIAGKMGVPMWVFYVNRGQCICSMGVQDKENPIMEFLPANWAYQLVSTQGFRTFLKFPKESDTNYYEPFQEHYRDREIIRTQTMHIAPSHLTLVEENETLGLKFRVEYNSVPEDNYAGLIRNLSITNLNNLSISFDGLDGLPLIIPYGIGNNGLKQMRRLMEAFVEVSNYDQIAPLFKAKVEPADRPDVQLIRKGNFYLGFESGSEGNRLLQPVVDPQCIFGSHNDYSFPARFLETTGSEIFDGQAFENRLPSAMSPFSKTLESGETYTLTSIVGHIDSAEELNSMLPRVSKNEYLVSKVETSINIIDNLTQNSLVVSEDLTFDMYVRQNFLDNVLRGGFPYTLKGKKGQSVLHLYSRKHGDLERDYNDYRITPSFYSQGNGNFRDINQNRRSDLFFNPDVGSNNLEHFVNLIQLDGFNPLVIKELRYRLNASDTALEVVKSNLGKDLAKSIISFMGEAHTPGELLKYLSKQNVEFPQNADEFLGDLLPACHKIHETDHAEGYWSDHWTYNLDLLENYLAIYPDKLQYILFVKQDFTFHDSPYHVRPRDEKYVIWDDKLMQLGALAYDEKKAAQIDARSHNQKLVRVNHGTGKIYRTNLFTKLICIITNKMASLDPSGIGVEMETDKPNWYDALNGLPGLMGSSLSETLEIKRHIQFLLSAVRATKSPTQTIPIFNELLSFMTAMQKLLRKNFDAFDYWDQSTTLKENFREMTHLGISGDETSIGIKRAEKYLQDCLQYLEVGIELGWDAEGKIPMTYLYHEVLEYEIIEVTNSDGIQVTQTNEKGLKCFRAKAFKGHQLPHFLEGPVHFLRCLPEHKQARKLVQNIRQSDLYDQKLRMYKVNASLADQLMEIGRARVFSPGWFENESIWLHMEYKYMLEMLRNKLYEDFFKDFKHVFIPYLQPETYGRSILENSSFLVSSANPDPGLHGAGFVARLSGATAEFIHILNEMMIGSNPFFTSKSSELHFTLKPVIPDWLFTSRERQINISREGTAEQVSIPANSFSFMFLGKILITYHNPTRKNTWGENGVAPMCWKVVDENGITHQISGTTIDNTYASLIRDRKIHRIEVELS
ncbi:MAG: hypothetical protein U9Q77_02080 [Candidatus Marinimicrobia bacterium]|nr:hypothetical protein [Candidatus Neomarinimicrobiota bacterium]